MTNLMDFRLVMSPEPIKSEELVELYSLIGWNEDGRRTPIATAKMLYQTPYYVAALIEGHLVGFGRVSGDIFVAQIVDLICHPHHREKGIGTAIMTELMAWCRQRYPSVMLVNGSGLPGFYEKFGFSDANSSSDRLMYWHGKRSG